MGDTGRGTRSPDQRSLDGLILARAPKKCGRLDCDTRVTGTTYCPEHTPVWQGSTRRSRLPTNWNQIRIATEHRANGRCEAQSRLNQPHHPDCSGLGSECDHVIPCDDHSLANTCWLSTPCHKAKTARESAARNRARTQPERRPASRSTAPERPPF